MSERTDLRTQLLEEMSRFMSLGLLVSEAGKVINTVTGKKSLHTSS
jgi:hypothetical protein